MTVELSILYVILPYGKAGDVLSWLHKHHARGATVIPVIGTVRGTWARFFGLDEVRKEMLIVIDETAQVTRWAKEICETWHMEKPNHGIVFTIALTKVGGVRLWKEVDIMAQQEQGSFQVIYTIVNRGDAKAVVDAATAVGAGGATICRGRGSVDAGGARLFDFPIEPEKELVIVLSRQERTQTIVEAIDQAIGIDEPGKGIMFVMNAQAVYGVSDQT